jgi:hypothetical protein
MIDGDNDDNNDDSNDDNDNDNDDDNNTMMIITPVKTPKASQPLKGFKVNITLIEGN